ncbi:uncharacterized protein LOC141594189 [Silene latifolia]|uniref:uncharacterized protein LOC141594189 n=1 Tax=Silene latifolia TaxID=37657 RepID=UPI003D78093D
MKTTTCDQLQQKRTSKGKQKIPITRIVDKNSRQVTFSKRRNGLFGKCSQLCSQFPNTHFAAITFSVGGKPFSVGYPSVDTVVNRFLDDTRKDDNFRNDVGDGNNNWWETPIDYMNLEDLEKFKEALEGLKTQVASRVGEQSTEIFNQESFDFPHVINCNDYECNYASPSPKLSDYCQEISESSDVGAIDADFGSLFDVIKSVDFGCNNAIASPVFSDNCPELLENIDFEAVDASHGAQLFDFFSEIESEIESIDFGFNAQTLTPQFCHNSQARRQSFNLTEVLKNIDVECQ